MRDPKLRDFSLGRLDSTSGSHLVAALWFAGVSSANRPCSPRVRSGVQIVSRPPDQLLRCDQQGTNGPYPRRDTTVCAQMAESSSRRSGLYEPLCLFSLCILISREIGTERQISL